MHLAHGWRANEASRCWLTVKHKLRALTANTPTTKQKLYDVAAAAVDARADVAVDASYAKRELHRERLFILAICAFFSLSECNLYHELLCRSRQRRLSTAEFL